MISIILRMIKYKVENWPFPKKWLNGGSTNKNQGKWGKNQVLIGSKMT
jgi:hypothetical protein